MILVKFYRLVDDQFIIIRTEHCTDYMEADAIVEAEEGHYDTVAMVDLEEKK
jgi:hypothetical protein